MTTRYAATTLGLPMKPILLTLYSEGELLDNLRMQLHADSLPVILHESADEETYIKIQGQIRGRLCLIFESLYNPNFKILPLLFLVRTLRDLGAQKIGLIAPFLPYTQNDNNSCRYFATLLSEYVDWVISVDVHWQKLSLKEIYTIPTQLVSVEEEMAEWVGAKVKKPLILSFHHKTQNWIKQVAASIEAPYFNLDTLGRYKTSAGFSEIYSYQSYTPILMDDVITSGKKMLKAVQRLEAMGLKPPVCLVIHGLFVQDAYESLLIAGAKRIITCNTIPHASNRIDLSGKIVEQLRPLLEVVMH